MKSAASAMSQDDTQETGVPQIRDAIREAIVERRLSPGTKLSESDVGNLFNVSRTLARAALLPRLVLLEEAADERQLTELRLDRAANREQAGPLRVHDRNERDADRDGVRPHLRLAAGAAARIGEGLRVLRAAVRTERVASESCHSGQRTLV